MDSNDSELIGNLEFECEETLKVIYVYLFLYAHQLYIIIHLCLISLNELFL